MKNLRRLACKFDIDQSERKSSQVEKKLGLLGTPFGQGFSDVEYIFFDWEIA